VALVAALALSVVVSVWIPLALLLPVAYLVGLVVAGLVTRCSTFRVAIALGTMHLSWRLGFLTG
jgi:hypothetical protein